MPISVLNVSTEFINKRNINKRYHKHNKCFINATQYEMMSEKGVALRGLPYKSVALWLEKNVRVPTFGTFNVRVANLIFKVDGYFSCLGSVKSSGKVVDNIVIIT